MSTEETGAGEFERLHATWAEAGEEGCKGCQSFGGALGRQMCIVSHNGGHGRTGG